jgi:translation initiation factor 1A
MYQSMINNGKKRTNRDNKHRALEEPDEGQSYGVVQDMIGNGRLRCLCSDNVIRLGKIRGSLRKTSHKIIIEKNDLILISFRDFEPDKVDILHKYTYEEANLIMNTFELPDCIHRALNMTDKFTSVKDEDNHIIFTQEASDEEEKYTNRDKALYPPMDDDDIDYI